MPKPEAARSLAIPLIPRQSDLFGVMDKSIKFVLDFEKNIGSFKYNFSPHYSIGQNYIIIEPTGIEYSIRGAFPVWEYRSISSLIRGFDFDFSLKLNKNFSVRSSSSWIEGFERKSKTPIINMPPFTSTNYIHFSIPRLF